MAGQAPDSTSAPLPGNSWMSRAKAVLITLTLWAYFLLGFCLYFAPFFLLAAIFTPARQQAAQKLNSRYFKGFFWLCRLLIPKHRWHIDPEIDRIRGAMVLANHISYLDSILMVSLFERHTTIAKARLFDFPFLGMNLNMAGYIPSSATGRHGQKMQQRIEALPGYLAQGGNLILFPEGTRSRTGNIGPYEKGGFKVARMCKAPIKVVSIRNTHRLFEPGRFLFHTERSNTIEVKLEGTLTPDYNHPNFSIDALMQEVHQLMAKATAKQAAP